MGLVERENSWRLDVGALGIRGFSAASANVFFTISLV